MKKSLLLSLFIILAHTCFSQALSSYAFSAFSRTYVPLTGSYVTATGGFSWGAGGVYDDSWYDGIPIGFNFVYGCSTYTSLLASDNNWVVLGETLPGFIVNTYDADLSNTYLGGLNLPRPILAPLWIDVTKPGPNLRYATTGIAPNRVFTIEWDSVSFFVSYGIPHEGAKAICVELKLYETSNIIEFAYHTIASAYASISGFESIGITGGDGAYPMTGAQPFLSLDGTGSAPTPSSVVDHRTLTGLPADNQVYKWNPACTGTPVCTVNASVASGCSPYSSSLSLLGLPVCVPGFTYQWQSSPDSTTWTTIVGATTSTYTAAVTASIYYRCIVTCTNSGLSYTTPGKRLNLGTPAGGIIGAGTLCSGSTLLLTDGTPGGTWSSSASSVASVGSSSGVVTGGSVGTATITYTLGSGCYSTATVTVVSAPSPIAGPSAVCQGNTILLTESISGGTWVSSDASIATAGSSTGIVGGILTGTVTITYALGACSATKIVTVNTAPPPPAGPSTVCSGLSITLTDAVSGGTWSSTIPSVATVISGTGVVTGAFGGTTTIIYTAPGGCTSSKTITVNPLPSPIRGPVSLCVGSVTTLFDFGGTWTSGDASIATVDPSLGITGGVAAGTVTITYTLPTGCLTTFSLEVDPLPLPITGVRHMCVGASTVLHDATSGGGWSTTTLSIATIDGFSGTVYGVTGGIGIISYVLPSTCFVTAPVTVDPLPPPITGLTTLCPGTTTALADVITGGTWSSSVTSIATIGSSSGIVYGITPGTTIITYVAPSGCSTSVAVTVYSNPSAITGTMRVCVGQTTLLSDASGGGTWTSGNMPVATVTPGPIPTGGTVTGVSAGTARITYTLGTGCFTTALVTVNTTPPPITGPHTVCLGECITLTDTTAGGTWTSSLPGIATVGSTGTVCGVSAGPTNITYSFGGVCVATYGVTVNPLPPPCTVSGGGSYCSGGAGVAIGLSCSSAGVSYQLMLGGSPVGVPVTGTGAPITFGLQTAAGVYTVIATNSTTGCTRVMTGSATITINPLPAVYTVGGGGAFCAGGTGVLIILSGSDPGVRYQLFVGGVPVGVPVTGTGSSLSFGPVTTAGTYTIVATIIATGCSSNMTGSATVTINPLPPLCSVTGGGSYCAGGTGVFIGLGCSTVGISYQLYLGVTPVGGAVAGTGSPISFGAFTAAGTYTVVATSPVTGCSRTMTGSAIVTISPLPTISGGTAVCVSSSMTLSGSPGGGTWSSSNPTNATVGSTSGTVTGLTTGTSTIITYTSTAGCTNTWTVSVSPSPGPITGANTVCVGACTLEGNIIPGGTWTSSSPATATAGLSSGMVCGLAPGPVTITYSLGSGCTVTKVMTVTPAPAAIGGPSGLCNGACVTLTDAVGGGTWSSGTPAVATVNSTGTVCGTGTGTATITYTVGGCSVTKTVTVNFAPTAITGPSSVCADSTIGLTDGVSGGTFSSSNPAVASVDPVTGVVTGGAVTTTRLDTISYSLGGTCVVTKVISVNPISPISGASGICVGANMTLSDAAGGGTWMSSSTGTATINSATGVLGGVAPGTTIITYTTPGGCMAIKTVTVQPAPGPITGPATVCANSCITLGNPVGGGIWSSSSMAIATAGSSSGSVCGVAAGSTSITYSLGGGCIRSVTVNVLPLPAITAVRTRICAGGNADTLTGAPGGGTWTSSNPGVASFGPSGGVVTSGVVSVPTTVDVTYTIGTGCSRTITLSVNPIPAPINGEHTICEGSSITLSDITPGGTWSSANPAIASVGSLTGIVTGGAIPGIIPIIYIAGGCPVTFPVTVIAPPGPITGAPNVCAGQTTTFTDATAGGTWSSANTDIAIIGASTGIITGMSSGTVIIYYTVGTGCTVFRTIIVNPLSPVTGPSVVCKGQTIVLTDTTEGGAWSSSNTAIATTRGITSTTGLITGVDSGVVTISYTLSTGCQATHIVSVNPGPPAITGIAKVCVGSVTALSDAAIGGGAWSSSDPATATVVSATGVVSGVSAGFVTITFTGRFTGCPATIVVTVNPLPDPISGPTDVCIGQTIHLTDGGGGTWASSDPSLATVGFTSGIVGGIIPGAVTITYTLPTGCTTSTIINVDAPPAPITGVLQICLGSSTTLSDATPGGTWSSSAAGIAMVDPAGNVTGMGLGTATISYSTAGSCTATAVVTVNPIPCGISGTTVICQGQTVTLTDCMPGGSWSSSDASVATIGSLSGRVVSTGPGTTVITYTIIATGCNTSTIVFVNPAPDPIIGPDAICVNTTVTETDATPGGSWSSTRPTIASVDISGDVFGVATGTSVISYTMPGSGCAATKTVTVNPQPGAIGGPTQVCVGAAIGLSDAITGGTWTSSDIGIASVDLSTGTVYGVAPGSADITYSLGAGCTTFTTVVVNEIPNPIPGQKVCEGRSITIFDLPAGGTWSSGTPAIATADPAGVIFGVSAGTVIISYILPVTGCFATTEVTVNPMPTAITGNPNICIGSTRTYLSTPAGGTWSSSNGAIATIVDPASGVTLGVALGGATITYSMGHSCEVYQPVTVVPLPQVFNVTGGGNYCDGGTGVYIGLSGSATGVNYLLYHGATATGTFAGTGGALDFGLQTVAGSYTVIAISTATTCSNIMSGSASVVIDPTVLPSVGIGAVPGDTVCQGTSTTYTAVPVNGGSAPVYSWDVNGTVVGISSTYTFIPADGDVITITMTSNGHCPSPATVHHSKTISVTPFQQPLVGIDITPNDTVCQGTLVSAAAAPSYGGPTPVYTWLKNGFSAGTGATYTFVPENGDSLRCIMISTYPCIVGSNTVSSAELVMTVDTPLLPLVRINASPGTSIGKNQFDTLTASVTNGGEHPTYQWYLNGWPIAGQTNSIYVSNNYSLTRQDSVSCMVTSDAVCSMTTHQWVYINASSVGVQQIGGSSDIVVIPNPNKGTFIIKGTLSGSIDQEVSYELTDMLGQVVYRGKTTSRNNKINEQVTLAHSIANGMYLLTLRTGEENKVFHVVIEQ